MTTAKRCFLVLVIVTVAALGVFATPLSAYTSANPTYSTNGYNRTHGGPYVTMTRFGFHSTTLTFVNPNPYYACFEYRTDGDVSQKIGPTNYNPAIGDGLYPFVCLATAGTQTMTFQFNRYVEVRSVFGAERNWDFDWTRFPFWRR